jgi:hypothetical protein
MWTGDGEAEQAGQRWQYDTSGAAAPLEGVPASTKGTQDAADSY